jgi:hypothetical protein
MAKAFLTGSFKLHNPSKNKQIVLDHVFDAYTLGLGEVLTEARSRLPEIREQGKVTTKNGDILDKYSEISITPFLPKSGAINYPIASTLKESILKEAAANIASHLMLEGTDQDPGYPEARDPSPDGYPNALKNLATVGADLTDEDESKCQLLRRAKGSVMPIYISRSRDLRILYDRKGDRFFLWIKMLPAGHKLCQQTIIDRGNLIDLNTGEVFNSKSKIALLLPLEVGVRNGEWHWQYTRFLEVAMNGQASIQSAKLIRKETKRGFEYFINVSFGFEVPDPYIPQSYLGIDRGVFFSMAYAVVDTNGTVLEMNHKDDGFRHERIAAGKRVQNRQARGKPVTVKDYRQKHLDSILHSVINDILDKAEYYQAMIVCEDLNIQIKGKFYKSAWKKMYKFLEYKCKMRGVPLWKNGIWAAYSSQICINCGELNRRRRRDGSAFVCPECGASYHSDEGAGVNIARRAMYKKKAWEKKGGYMAFHGSFANLAGFEAKTSLRNAKVGFV